MAKLCIIFLVSIVIYYFNGNLILTGVGRRNCNKNKFLMHFISSATLRYPYSLFVKTAPKIYTDTVITINEFD